MMMMLLLLMMMMCFAQVVSSVPPDYVVDPFWMSQRGERVGPATTRRHRPFNYEFMEAKYWPHPGGRYGKATSQLGYRPNPACTDCHFLPAAFGDDPPSLRVPRRRSAQPDPPISISSKLPPYKVYYPIVVVVVNQSINQSINQDFFKVA